MSEEVNVQAEGELPEILYHYTSVDGLKGIFENKELWATNINFLNDESEYSLVQDLFKNYDFSNVNNSNYKHEYTSLGPESFDTQGHSLFISKIYKQLSNKNVFFKEVFIVSFAVPINTKPTEMGDSLSMWRSYYPKGGYAIGFNSKKLQQLIASFSGFTPFKKLMIPSYLDNVSLKKCIYYDPQKPEQLIDPIDRALLATEKIFKEDHFIKENHNQLELVKSFVSDLSACIKNDAFKYENEYRIIINNLDSIKVNPQYRSKNGYFIPYVSFPLRSLTEPEKLFKDLIKNVIIGPMPRQELAKEGLRHFLDSQGLTEEICSVQTSKIPFREF